LFIFLHHTVGAPLFASLKLVWNDESDCGRKGWVSSTSGLYSPFFSESVIPVTAILANGNGTSTNHHAYPIFVASIAAKWWKPPDFSPGGPAIKERRFSAGDSLKLAPPFLPFSQLFSPLFGFYKYVIWIG
jgi:hypothetical protein